MCFTLQVKNFTLQIAETLLPNNQAILMVYIRFLNDKSELGEEILFVCSLMTDTKGAKTYQTISMKKIFL